MSEDTPYKVGYGKPPLHTQFKKNTSGFEGRHHTKKVSVSQLLDQILEEKVEVSESGRKKRMTKREVFLRQLLARAISGERQACRILFDYLERRSQDPANAAPSRAVDDFLLAELAQLYAQKPTEADDDAA